MGEINDIIQQFSNRILKFNRYIFFLHATRKIFIQQELKIQSIKEEV